MQVGYTDTSGKALTDYPRPSVAVDVALLAVVPHAGLSVLLVRRKGRHRHAQWQQPGTFLHEGETLSDAANRALLSKVGVQGLCPVQLTVLDAPDRDDRGWVLSVAHLDVVPQERLTAAVSDAVRLTRVSDARGLAFDHDEIVQRAVERLRSEYDDAPDPRGLLEEPFTLLELQRLHEAVFDRSLPKDSFRRAMEGQLQHDGNTRAGVVGKPARLFRRR